MLKDDFENGGKAFAAFAISMFGEIRGALGELSIRTTEQQAEIIKRLDSLAHLTPGTLQADQAFKDLAEEVKSGFSKVLEQMGLANTNIAMLLDKVRAIGATVKETLTVVQGLDQKSEEHLVLLRGIDEQIQSRDPSIIPQDDPHSTVSNWQGRSEELQQMQAWLEDANVQLIGIIALGGFGKSTLAAKIYKESTGFAGKFWVDVRQGSDFTRLARRAIGRLRQQSEEAVEKIQESELIGQLVKCLQDERHLLVIDNLETLLHSNGQWRDATYRAFFHRWLGCGGQSVLLVTSRERSNLKEVIPHWLELPGLQPEEGVPC